MDKLMAKGTWFIPMAIFTMVNSRMVRHTVLESILRNLERFMKANGNKTNLMEKE